MSGIRKQAIISSILVYIGVLFGAINNYFFVKDGSFLPQQYGLTRIFSDVGQNFFIFASLGAIPVLYKFFPYYQDNLEEHENDLFGRTLLMSFLGCILVGVAGYFLEPLFIQKFSNRSPLFVQYYFWVFPFAFGLLFFSLLEGYAWALQKTILSNFLRETVLRILTTVIILLYYFKLIDFRTFMVYFSFLYLVIAFILLFYLVKTGHLKFQFKKSRVTKKFYRKMFTMQSLVFGGIIITTIGSTIDGLIIASLLGLEPTGIYTLALYVANLIQIPQRSMQSIATGVLVRMWKDKNYAEILRIYQRSSINMLLISIFIFGNIWLNVHDGLNLVNIQDTYASGIGLLLIFGIIRIIDAGTGVNAQVIGASNYWRFEFLSGVIMLAIRIPLSYLFVKSYGIIGTAYSDLISLTIYNFIRFEFLRRKFNMQPFSLKTIYTILCGFAAYFIAYFILRNFHNWPALFLRSLTFSAILGVCVFLFRLSPDALQLVEVAKNRLRKYKN
ncbi:MAG: polysaccharide biosynthesis C-terminal domain-containing protein [Bacteroidetes bacterium]|nr:polysaccharide biosynthesis C-terminal domain-containing protein [Bacteroidota bacterium]